MKGFSLSEILNVSPVQMQSGSTSKANYATIFINSLEEMNDIDQLAQRVASTEATANGFTFAWGGHPEHLEEFKARKIDMMMKVLAAYEGKKQAAHDAEYEKVAVAEAAKKNKPREVWEVSYVELIDHVMGDVPATRRDLYEDPADALEAFEKLQDEMQAEDSRKKNPRVQRVEVIPKKVK
jgi:hypothetical protein